MVVFPSINPLGALGDALQWLYALQLLVELESRRFSMGRVKSSIFQKTGALNKQKQLVFIRKNAKLAENWVLANRLEEIEAANRCMQMISAAKTGWFHQNTTI